jgi:hypothetical protein
MEREPIMNITENKSIREKYNQGFIRDRPITEIVIHATAGFDSSLGIINWMLGGERGIDYAKGIALFHYLNDMQGEITEIIDPSRYVFHSSSGSHDKETIGIENIKPTRDNSGMLPEPQLTALCELIEWLLESIPTITRIVSHDFNAMKFSNKPPKPCPGDMEWQAIEFHLTTKGYNVLKISDQQYSIERSS